MFKRITLLMLCASAQSISAFTEFSGSDQGQVFNVEIAIVGGGATGTYSAVRLREDFNISIIVIEPRDHLGGHVSTYTVPETNTTLEYGVQSYVRNQAAFDFYARFNISTLPFAAKRLTAINVDVETGARLEEYISPAANATAAALKRWLDIVIKYEYILEPGYWNFPQPQDIPAELLVPVEDFVKQNELEAAIPRIVSISGVGYGGIRHLLTFNLMQAFGATLTRQVLDGELLLPIGSNSLIYQRALALLHKDVLLSTTVQSVQRHSNGATLRVKQGDREYQINAKRILYTAPPSLTALAPYDLDDKEKGIFSQWAIDGEWIGVAKISCIPENFSINYIPSAVLPNNQVAIKDWPYSLRFDSTGPTGFGLFRVILGANYTISSAEYKWLVAEGVQKIQDAGTVTGNCTVEFKAMSDHTRPVWKQSAAQLKEGFVQDLYSLQGYKNMWYTGSIWGAPYSSTLWAYTDTVLPKLLADLKNDYANN
jgi:hypothetical protein